MLFGVIGEYIARIYEQVKMRPHYILESDLESKDSQDSENQSKRSKDAKSSD